VARTRDAKDFATHFVAVTRQAVDQNAHLHRNAQKAKQLADVHSSTVAFRQAIGDGKSVTQKAIADDKERRVKDAKFAKYLVEQRRKRMVKAAEERLEDVHEMRGVDRERAKTAFVKSRDKKGKPADRFIPTTDQSEIASIEMKSIMGRHVGQVESHLIVDVIAEALET
jgi:hypothetical protein